MHILLLTCLQLKVCSAVEMYSKSVLSLDSLEETLTVLVSTQAIPKDANVTNVAGVQQGPPPPPIQSSPTALIIKAVVLVIFSNLTLSNNPCL